MSTVTTVNDRRFPVNDDLCFHYEVTLDQRVLGFVHDEPAYAHRTLHELAGDIASEKKWSIIPNSLRDTDLDVDGHDVVFLEDGNGRAHELFIHHVPSMYAQRSARRHITLVEHYMATNTENGDIVAVFVAHPLEMLARGENLVRAWVTHNATDKKVAVYVSNGDTATVTYKMPEYKFQFVRIDGVAARELEKAWKDEVRRDRWVYGAYTPTGTEKMVKPLFGLGY